MRFGGSPSFRNQPAEAQAGRNPIRKTSTNGGERLSTATLFVEPPTNFPPQRPKPRISTVAVQPGKFAAAIAGRSPSNAQRGWASIHASWPQDYGFPRRLTGRAVKEDRDN